MRKSKTLLPVLMIFGLLFGMAYLAFTAGGNTPVLAQQAYQTPTPGVDGKIIYTVQGGDTCTRIMLLTGVPIEKIISLNGLDQACSLQEGEKLLIGQVEAAVMTQTAVPTATTPPELITPTATPSAGFATVCVVLFNDLDGTGMRTAGEDYLYGGVVSLSDRLGKVSLTGNTVAGSPDTVEPLCFNDIPEGSYNLSIAIPDGFNPTTVTNYPLDVKAGELATIDFGAQEATAAPQPEEGSGGQSPLIGIIGGVILISGLGLGFYMWRQRKS